MKRLELDRIAPIPMELYDALHALDGENFERLLRAYINEFRNPEKLERQKMLASITEFQNTFMRSLTSGIQEQVNAAQRDYDNYVNEAIKMYKRLQDYHAQLEYYKPSEQVKEFLDYLPKRKGLIGFRKQPGSNGTYEFAFFLPCVSYDKDALTRSLERADNRYAEYGVEKFFRTVFLDEDYRLYFHQTVYARLNPQNPNLGSNNYRVYEPKGISNPHLGNTGLSCFGTYREQIQRAIMENDYITMLEFLATSVSSLNFLDGVVQRKFCTAINSNAEWTKNPCVLKQSTNTWYTIKQILEGAHETH
jgi:hypothetical protein